MAHTKIRPVFKSQGVVTAGLAPIIMLYSSAPYCRIGFYGVIFFFFGSGRPLTRPQGSALPLRWLLLHWLQRVRITIIPLLYGKCNPSHLRCAFFPLLFSKKGILILQSKPSLSTHSSPPKDNLTGKAILRSLLSSYSTRPCPLVSTLVVGSTNSTPRRVQFVRSSTTLPRRLQISRYRYNLPCCRILVGVPLDKKHS